MFCRVMIFYYEYDAGVNVTAKNLEYGTGAHRLTGIERREVWNRGRSFRLPRAAISDLH